MKILAIDYGRRNVGLALSTQGLLSRPLGTIRVSGMRGAVDKVLAVCQSENPQKIILGIVKGSLEEEIKQFGKFLSQNFEGEIIFWDETLSSKEARKLLSTLGKRRKQRESQEHSFAAAMILDSYLNEVKASPGRLT